MSLPFHDLLTYALGCDVPEHFSARLFQLEGEWDEAFRTLLDELACEFRPDLVRWEISVVDGRLHERRLAPPLQYSEVSPR